MSPKAKEIELSAIEVKKRYGFGPYEAVDPFDLAARMGVTLVASSWLDSLPDELRQTLGDIAGSWSAGSLAVGEATFILINQQTSRTRQMPSLGEELAHIALGHPKSKLMTIDGMALRTCNHQVEDEAYAVSTALLMPYRPLFNHLNASQPLEELPTPVPVSQACREYRAKKAGLWRLHMARARTRSQAAD